MSNSVALQRPADRLALTDEEIAELVGASFDRPSEAKQHIEEDGAPGDALLAGAGQFLGSRWGLQSRPH
jgi:hypothetical protein